ncbi:MAG: transposase, partial [Candidatus Acidiferrales bacterium]
MPRYGRLLTDAQWEKIRPLLPKPPKRPRGRRPRAADRKVLQGHLVDLAQRPYSANARSSFGSSLLVSARSPTAPHHSYLRGARTLRTISGAISFTRSCASASQRSPASARSPSIRSTLIASFRRISSCSMRYSPVA